MTNISCEFQLSRKGFDLDVKLNLPSTGVTVIYGPSGCGKTTLLRCMAGLESDTAGSLQINNENWQDQNTFIPTFKRPLGMVFQESSLLSHLTAQGNLDFAIKRCSGKPEKQLADQMCSVMGISTLLDKRPDQLSGGERQRVAIARALLAKPQLLLMDEPLASLDGARKAEILPYLEKIKADYDLPIIYVTHSVEEMARLADYVVVMDSGRIKQQGPALELLSELNLPFQYGDQAGVIVEGCITEKDEHWQLDRVTLGDSNITIRASGLEIGQPVRIRILARDVSIALSEQKDSSILNKIPVTISEVVEDKDPATCLIKLKTAGQYIIARTTTRSAEQLSLKAGDKVWAQIKSAAIVR